MCVDGEAIVFWGNAPPPRPKSAPYSRIATALYNSNKHLPCEFVRVCVCTWWFAATLGARPVNNATLNYGLTRTHGCRTKCTDFTILVSMTPTSTCVCFFYVKYITTKYRNTRIAHYLHTPRNMRNVYMYSMCIVSVVVAAVSSVCVYV